MNKSTMPRVRHQPVRARGFTLVELMIMVAMIAILAAIAVPKYQDYIDRARLTAMVAEISGGKVGVESLLSRSPRRTPAFNTQANCAQMDIVVWPKNPVAKLSCSSRYGEAQLWYSTEEGWSCNVFNSIRDWAPANCKPYGIDRPDP